MKAVLITTDKDKRGVFMGYVEESEIEALHKEKRNTIRAKDIRMCVYWDKDITRGVIGLAGNGPSEKCRITSAAPSGVLDGVTAILEITKEAEEKWKKEPWG